MKKNKVIVALYKGDDWQKKIPIQNALTRQSFQDWHERGLKCGVEMYRASIEWFDEKKNVFTKAWAYRDGRWIKINRSIRADLIFDKVAGRHDFLLFEKKLRIANKTKIFNSPLFRTLVDNKLSQYLILGEFMAKSFVIESEAELKKVLPKIKSSKIVLKPLYGSGGFGIIISEKNKLRLKHLQYPLFAQEFIVSERGIPGFSQKGALADLRMIFFNHKLVYALSRIARRGSLFTNLHQGASAVLVPGKSIPQSAKKISAAIIKKLSVFPEAHYSLDFMFTNSGQPVLIEMNTTPGVDLLYTVGDEKLRDKNFQSLINLVK